VTCVYISFRGGAVISLVFFSFGEHSSVTPETLLAFIEQSRPNKKAKEKVRAVGGLRVPVKAPAPEPVRLTPDQRLIIALDEHIEQVELFQRIEAVLGFLNSR